MRIAFYAPMKPPDYPSPSGDRRMARLLMGALAVAGHEVELASRLRSYDGEGNAYRQRKLRAIGGRMAERLIRSYRRRPADKRPQVWFTYHLYHKAPDWLGPPVSQALGIPYVVAEASYAPKQENGPWAEGFDAAARAIASADLVLCPNSNDRGCVLPIIGNPDRLVSLTPFIDTSRFSVSDPGEHRKRLAAGHGIDTAVPWLLTVAMMRPGDKLASYRVLGESLEKILDRPWRLMVCGYGSAQKEAEAALAPLGDRVTWFGQMEPTELASLYVASDLFLWPAVNEAYGMAFLEAQAAGLPVVAGNSGGVPDVVSDNESGMLVTTNDPPAFAAAVAWLVEDAPRRREMGAAARQRIRTHHDIAAGAAALNDALGILTVEDS